MGVCQAAGTLLTVPADDGNIHHSSSNADAVGHRPGHVEADLSVHDVGDGDEGIPSTGDQRHPNPLGLAVLEHPDGNGQEGEQGQGLVGPCEVTPQDSEALCIELCEHQDHSHQSEDHGGQTDTLALGALIDVEGLRDLQTQAAQSGIAGGDGQYDDTHQGDQAAHGAQDVLADHADGAGRH
mgnify:CR=1 FL=1